MDPRCLEIQIINGNAGDLYPIGGFQGKGSSGVPLKFREGRIAEPKVKADGWNRMEVKVLGGTVEVSINGKVVNRAKDCPQEAGMVTLRNEGSRVEFRRLLLLPLD